MKPDTPPPERTWTFSFSVTRKDPEGGDENVRSMVKRMTVLDFALIGGLVTIFLLEPLAIYMFLTRHGASPLLAERCGGSTRMVVVQGQGGPDGADLGAQAPGSAVEDRYGGDVITPLNVRDPSALVMGPSRQ